MATIVINARRIFFDVPYATPPTLYNDLPQAIRDQWVGASRANKIGFLDYKNEIRQADDAYLMLCIGDMLANAGSTSIYSPPAIEPAEFRTLDTVLASATDGDLVTVRLARDIELDTTILLWATAPAATPSDVDTGANKFLGSYTFAGGSVAGATSRDFGADYVAAFGSLAGHVDESIVFWAFTCLNGNLRYVGAWTVPVTTVSIEANDFYWPLTESFGARRSIVEQHNFNVIGAPSQVAGPITDAVQVTRTPAAGLSTTDSRKLSPDGQDFSVSGWLKLTNLTYDAPLLINGTYHAGNTEEWHLGFNNATNHLAFGVADGGSVEELEAIAFGTPPTGTWIHLVGTCSWSNGRFSIYVNGVLSNTDTPPAPLAPQGYPVSVGILTLGNESCDAAFAEVTYWQRELTDNEVSALYNSGAALRWPYVP